MRRCRSCQADFKRSRGSLLYNCIAKDPTRRYASAEQLLDAVREYERDELERERCPSRGRAAAGSPRHSSAARPRVVVPGAEHDTRAIGAAVDPERCTAGRCVWPWIIGRAPVARSSVSTAAGLTSVM